MENHQVSVTKCGIPIIQKTTFVVLDIVDGVSAPIWETENYLDALAMLTDLRKVCPFIHQYKIQIKS